MTEEALSKFADKMTALYGEEGVIEIWLDSIQDLRDLERVFLERGCRAEVREAKQTLTVWLP